MASRRAAAAPLLDHETIGHEGRVVSDDHQSRKMWLRLLSCSTQIETANGKAQEKQAVLDENDAFWLELRHLFIAEVHALHGARPSARVVMSGQWHASSAQVCPVLTLLWLSTSRPSQVYTKLHEKTKEFQARNKAAALGGELQLQSQLQASWAGMTLAERSWA